MQPLASASQHTCMWFESCSMELHQVTGFLPTSHTRPSTVSIFLATGWLIRVSSASSTRRPCSKHHMHDIVTTDA